MLTFTAKGRGRGVYTKLRLINEMKTYVTYLIANSKADIYFFSNIEVGTELSNPHLHTQIWSDDLNAVRVVYDKVIEKFGLVKKRCQLSEPQQNHTFYNYVIKDYAKDLNDDELWNLEQTKKRMRKQLGLKLRFYSKSKSKYTKKAYRYFYRAFGVLRGVADKFMDYFFSIFFKKERVFKQAISSFIAIRNKGGDVYSCCFDTGRLFDILLVLSYAPSTGPPFSCCREDGLSFYWCRENDLVALHMGRYVFSFLCGSLLTGIGLLVYLLEILCLIYFLCVGLLLLLCLFLTMYLVLSLVLLSLVFYLVRLLIEKLLMIKC